MSVGVAGVANYTNTSSGTATNVVARYGIGGRYEYCSFFSVLNWFAQGEQGAWYDPSDLTTLFQESSGVTPMAAVGTVADQPVGLMLDKSKGLALGAELVTNGDFSNGTTGWSLGAGYSISDGILTATNVTGGGIATNSGTVQAYNWYLVTADVVCTAGNWTLYVGGVGQLYGVGTFALRTYVFSTAVTGIYLGQRGVSFSGTIDNISVRQIAGNHAFQATSANRPILSARVNNIVGSDGFSGGILTPTNGLTVTGTSLLDPRGGFTARKYTNSTNSTLQRIYVGATGLGSLTYSVEVKYVDAQFIQLDLTGTSTGTSAVTFDLVNKTYSLAYTVAAPTATITPLANGYLRLSIIGYPETSAIQNLQLYVLEADPVVVTPTTTGTNKSVIVAGADLRPTNSGALLPPYQRVNTASDYDSVGFPLYLKCNGLQSAMSTNSIDFTATDKMTVVTGVRKLSDALQGSIVELSNTGALQGSFGVIASQGASGGPNYCALLSGTSSIFYSPIGYPSPTSNVVSLLADISKSTALEELIPRINGAVKQTTLTGTTAGTGDFGNYPLYLFARAGTSFWFNGHFYGAIIRGAQSDTASVIQTENYMAQKTGITF